MSVTKSFAGTSYNLPLNLEAKNTWGVAVSNFLIALADQAIPKQGGTQTLLAELNLGATYGIVLPYLKSSSGRLTLNTTGTITLPNITGNAVTTGDTGTVTSTMILNDTILNADINSAAGIVDTKLDTIATAGKVLNSATTATSSNTASAIVARDGAGNFTATTITASLAGNATTATLASTVTTNANLTGHITSTGNATLLGSFTSAQLATALSDETGSGAAVFGTGPSIGSPTFTDYTLYTEASAPSTPASGKVAVYAKTDKKMYRKGSDGVETEIGSGAGSGAINYISNADLETGATTGWATYKDAAAATPVDGTGGSPTTLTLSANSSSPMRGSYDFKVVKSAANSQGEGFSYDFTIKTPDKSKKLSLSFDLNSNDVNFTASDVVIYVYDVTNSTLITPSSTGLPKVGASTYNITFDSTTSTSYRLIFHWAVTTATAVSLYFDNFILGPGTITQGAAISEWQSYTPTLTNGTNLGTPVGQWRRVGSAMELYVAITATGSGSGGTVTISLPTGYSANTTVAPAGTTLGAMRFLDSGVLNYAGCVVANTSTTFYGQRDGVAASVSGTDFTLNDALFIEATVPIAEWAGNGTVNLGAGAQVEYVSNSDVTVTGSVTVSTSVAGPNGSIMPTGVAAGAFTKAVRFQYPIQSDDVLFLEVQRGGGVWQPIETATYQNGLIQFIYQNSITYGIGLDTAYVNSTDVTVAFGKHASATGTYGAAGTDWNNAGIQNYRWRVRKAKASSPVGFGLAGTDGSSGLYKAGQAPGLTTGAAIAAGYVGELLTNSTSGVSLTTATYNEAGTLTLTAGVWDISGHGTFSPAASTSITRLDIGIGTAAGNSSTGLTLNENYDVFNQVASVPGNDIGRITPIYRVSISASTTYYLKMRASFTVSTMTCSGYIRAVRVG